jgi:hypothetical protein
MAPVYSIWVIDKNSGSHLIVVDPQNGKVLFANQPMSMTGLEILPLSLAI